MNNLGSHELKILNVMNNLWLWEMTLSRELYEQLKAMDVWTTQDHEL